MKRLLVKAILLVFTCSIAFAQMPISDHEQAVMDAKFDAQNADTFAWIIPGFLCGVFGVAFAYLMPPTVPTYRLMGKSPDYITTYTISGIYLPF